MPRSGVCMHAPSGGRLSGSFSRWVAGSVLFLFLLLLVPALSRAQKDSLVLGMSAAFTGPSRALGIELYRGAMAYFNRINAQGGINGRRIVLLTADDGYNPEPAVSNTLRFIKEDNVLALFSYVGTPTTTRILPLIKRYSQENILLLFPFSGSSPLREPPYAEYVFNLRGSYRQETQGLIENFIQAGKRRFAVFYQVDAYGRSGWAGVRESLQQHGLDIVAEATYRRGASFAQSMQEQVDILRRAAPDAIISIGAYAACAAFIRDVRNSGWDIPVANLSFSNMELMLQLLLQESARNNRSYTRGLVFSQAVPSLADTSIAAVQDYRELIRTVPVRFPSHFDLTGYSPPQLSSISFEGFLNAKIFVEAVRRIQGEVTREALQSSLESLTNYPLGRCCSVAFGPHDHQGLETIFYSTIDRGLVTPLSHWSHTGP